MEKTLVIWCGGNVTAVHFRLVKLLKIIVVMLLGYLNAEHVLADSKLEEASRIVSKVESKQFPNTQASEIVSQAAKRLNETDLTEAKQLVNSLLRVDDSKKIDLKAEQISSQPKVINLNQFVKGFNEIKAFAKSEEEIPSLMVFASFGLPKQTLQQLTEQVRKADGVLVFRGVHEGSLKKTITMMQELNEKGTNAIIHPEYFKRFNITTVPVFVLGKGQENSINDKCTQIIDKLTGNVPLKYVLETFAEKGENRSIAKQHLKKLGGEL